MSLELFALVIFLTGACIFAQASLVHNPPNMSQIAGMTGACHHVQFID
jgi:hypothetical protein